ncbi:para-aminobenzoate synthase, (PABA) [Tilletia horrida]|uniref:aminodeoxychorismate synthase n=1 Tax=Tilletia horrida TaxID=155126 RepID=A0AAN6JR55_9BASI|nr:para-aminobenzoate synthase, (PABA) [Tilletia horrida]
MPPEDWAPRLLIIDHYDSYTANLLTLLPPAVCANTVILQHTHKLLADPVSFAELVAPFIDGIIISPGPGSPENAADFGTSARILRDCMRQVKSGEEDRISPLRFPVLGVCLGHQGIACVAGASLKRTRTLQHGSQSALVWSSAGAPGSEGTGLFEGVPQGAAVVRYNSLVVDEDTLPECLHVSAWSFDPPPTASSPAPSAAFLSAYSGDLPPPNGLAQQNASGTHHAQTGLVHEKVVMALEHVSLPISGVQFHPESIESSHGRRLMQNFLSSVWTFWKSSGSHGPNPTTAKSRVCAWRTAQSLPEHLLSAGLASESVAGPSHIPIFRLPKASNGAVVPSQIAEPVVATRSRPASAHSSHSWTSHLSSTGSLLSANAHLGVPHSSATSTTSISGPPTPAKFSPAVTPQSEKTCHEWFTDANDVRSSRWRVLSHSISAAGDSTMPKAEAAPLVFDRLFRQKDPSALGSVWLDSARPRDPHSRYSYMARPKFLLSYQLATRIITVKSAPQMGQQALEEVRFDLPQGTTFWDWMSGLQSELQAKTDFVAAMDSVEALSSKHSGTSHSSSESEEQDRYASVFKGGFVGYFGYEIKAESLGLETALYNEENVPDAEFMFCDKVLCYDHISEAWSSHAVSGSEERIETLTSQSETSAHMLSDPLTQLQSALQDMTHDVHASYPLLCDSEAKSLQWFRQIAAVLYEVGGSVPTATEAFLNSMPSDGLPTMQCDDNQQTYRDKVEMARKFIAAGESYELCITTAFRGARNPVKVTSSEAEADRDHFGLYCALRRKNAAPYSAYIQLPPMRPIGAHQRGRAILSTSPERFMRVLRSGEAEMKPIKGTLARAGHALGEAGMLPLPAGSQVTPEQAEEELRKGVWRREQDLLRRAKLAADPKERAENLMIVDLIRADLLSCCHPSSVRVPKLMRVETYATIHQLVTTVRGQLRPQISSVEALRRCFPPGSMTGAPKRRSVQILESLEGHGRDSRGSTDANDKISRRRPHRSIYSGALGWLGLDGSADFAVVIRTAVADGDDVYVGAGGAVTFLSTAQGELSEMLDKARSVGPVSMEP